MFVGRTTDRVLVLGSASDILFQQPGRVRSKFPADELAFVEAHGTGTPAGDPIEAGAIGRGLGKSRKTSPLTIGSIKTNIGHLEAASGIAGAVERDFGYVPPAIAVEEGTPLGVTQCKSI